MRIWTNGKKARKLEGLEAALEEVLQTENCSKGLIDTSRHPDLPISFLRALIFF